MSLQMGPGHFGVRPSASAWRQVEHGSLTGKMEEKRAVLWAAVSTEKL